MHNFTRILLIFLLSRVLAEEVEQNHIIFLNRVVQRVEKKVPIATLVILQHHQDMNCILQDWNPSIPSLRVNEWTKIIVRENFNRVALAVVCMGTDFEVGLLDVVANLYEDIRYQRIILLTKKKPSKEFLDQVAKQAKEHKSVHLVVLEMSDDPSAYQSFFRWNFAHSGFSLLSIQEEMFPGLFQFYGMTATVKSSEVSLQKGTYNPAEVIPVYQIEYMEICEFARRSNLSLKFLDGNHSDTENFDLQISERFVNKNTSVSDLGFVNPLVSSSVVVVVPCAHEMSLKNIFNQLDLRTWLLYILYLYCTLVLVETFILVVTLRIRHQPYGLVGMGSLVNLRAFRALLGMPFPICPRASLSLRQLFLAMSLFGMVFSGFFSCKLSALLTKHPAQGQVTNFEELRDSGLPVAVGQDVHSLIEGQLGVDFYHWLLPTAQILPDVDRFRLLMSLNTSYAYIIFKESIRHLNYHQKTVDRKAFCASEELTIIGNHPRVYTLQKNSILKWPLSAFVLSLQEAGVSDAWMRWAHRRARTFFNTTYADMARPKVMPLGFEHLKWLGYLLTFGYGAATLVFIAEVLLGKSRATYRGYETEA